MFNKGNEIALFNRLGFNAVFYGEVLVGSKMPNLMYMTSFENRASRDAHWKAFSEDPEWKKLSAMSEYKNNVSKNTDRIFKANRLLGNVSRALLFVILLPEYRYQILVKLPRCLIGYHLHQNSQGLRTIGSIPKQDL